MFTQAQRDVLDKVHELLSEHFEGAVYVVQADLDSETPNAIWGGWIGGLPLGIGLCDVQAAKMRRRLVEPPPDTDDGDTWKQVPA